MPELDFGSSSEGSEGSGGDSWAKNAERLSKKKQQQAAEEQKRQDEQALAERRRNLRNREREVFSGSTPMDTGEGSHRVAARQRAEQSIDAAKRMLDDSSESEESATKKANKDQPGIRSLEDDFMHVEGAEKTMKSLKSIDDLPAETANDFDRLADRVVEKLRSTLKRTAREDNDVLYMACLKRIITGAVEPLYPEDVKELSDVCARISAEMYRREQDKKKKKKGSGKPQIYVGGSSSGHQKYDNACGYDDFI
ncbi:Translation initiation factor eIF3 subunit [Giardia muris]|uniref:Translation initiation factor eIF3 subunit n=1 Tax=Giardia muris TaxID=5742 RepID=A0A4Z1T3S1_GIAMU|nr:Translation initiation factor eIF3 subunit [Giardia muris]TNJ27041.1 Translation initiation factor eIF3 subunit [Giardia muris]|eukprot:TNJ27036.1 Translation initiation factor eIF3 subunit [Giardia muris]